MKKAEIISALRRLTVYFGHIYNLDMRLDTLEVCFDEGIKVDGSTIDCIVVHGYDVRLYYNVNENDYDLAETFSAKSLERFYKAVKRNVIKETADYECRTLITASWDREEIIDNILDEIIEVIDECASSEGNFNNSDVRLAITRVLLRITAIGK